MYYTDNNVLIFEPKECRLKLDTHLHCWFKERKKKIDIPGVIMYPDLHPNVKILSESLPFYQN